MAAKKPPVRMRLEAAPTARTAMMRAVSFALTILETTKQPSWSALAAEVRAEAPKVRASLLTLDIDPDTATLLVEQAAIVDLIRYGPGSAGRKPTTTTVLTCAACGRWLIGVPTSGTPVCVLTLGCSGKLVPTKKATKTAPAPPAMEPGAARSDPLPDPAQPDPVADERPADPGGYVQGDTEPADTDAVSVEVDRPAVAVEIDTAADVTDPEAAPPVEPQNPIAARIPQPGDQTIFD